MVEVVVATAADERNREKVREEAIWVWAEETMKGGRGFQGEMRVGVLFFGWKG